MGDLATTFIIPSALKYQNLLLENIRGLKEAGLPESAYASQKAILTDTPNTSASSVKMSPI